MQKRIYGTPTQPETSQPRHAKPKEWNRNSHDTKHYARLGIRQKGRRKGNMRSNRSQWQAVPGKQLHKEIYEPLGNGGRWESCHAWHNKMHTGLYVADDVYVIRRSGWTTSLLDYKAGCSISVLDSPENRQTFAKYVLIDFDCGGRRKF
jgi:hypothetical protein